MTGAVAVLITTFLASTVEAIEMVTIVLGVGATRGWRSTLLGAGAGFLVLGVVVGVLGMALSAIPIGGLRGFKGVLLEGLEVAFIVVSFGANASRLGVCESARRCLPVA